MPSGLYMDNAGQYIKKKIKCDGKSR